MAKVLPFKAIRPVRDKVGLVTTRSYISYSKRHLKYKLESNPFSFVHVINPEGINPSKKRSLKEKYALVKSKFEDFQHKGYFLKDKEPAIYLYRQSYGEVSFTGLIGLASLEDYEKGIIKRHELTISTREQMFMDYLNVTRIHAEPVLITYKGNRQIENVKDKYLKQRPEYEFTTHDEVLHELWLITDQSDLEELRRSFELVDTMYIADGHHRIASSYQLSYLKKDPKYDHVLAYFLPDDQLVIHGFSRAIKLGKLSHKEFMDGLKQFYSLKKGLEQNQDQIGFYYQNQWYTLEERSNSSLSVEYFTNHILLDVLKIKDLRKSKQVNYLPSFSARSFMESIVDSGKMDALFVIPPISMEDLKQTCNQNKVLPPKSTWIEPKLRSALVIYSYDD